jgi:hypothetical protein
MTGAKTAWLVLAGLSALAAPLYAQESQNTENGGAGSAGKTEVTQEFTGTTRNGGVSRTIGSYTNGKYCVFGLADVSRDGSYFAKIEAERKLGNRSVLILDFEKAGGDPGEIGLGFGYEIPMPKKLDAHVHVLPLKFDRNGYLGKTEIESEIEADLGRGFYLQNRTIADFIYRGKPEIKNETTIGKKLNSNWSVQGRAFYSSGSWHVGGGVRYTWGKKK